jgi:hypothetical protein
VDGLPAFVKIFTQAVASVAIVYLALFRGASRGWMSHLPLCHDLGTVEFGMWSLGLYL